MAMNDAPVTGRIDFVLFFDVTDGNPNGDPDADNMPRMDPETGQGIVTDVCIKRKVRNYVEATEQGNAGNRIYVREGAVLNDIHAEAYAALDIPLPKDAKAKDVDIPALTRWMCDNFYDVRTFGAVMSTGINCGQVRGPVQLAFARSIDPIVPQEICVTRVAVTTREEAEKGNDRTMGRKYIVPYALYRMEGFISAPLAEARGFTQKDLQIFWNALANMFELDRSAARGKMTTRAIYAFEHEGRFGNAPAQELFDLVRVKRLDPSAPARSFADYELALVDDIPEGVKGGRVIRA